MINLGPLREPALGIGPEDGGFEVSRLQWYMNKRGVSLFRNLEDIVSLKTKIFKRKKLREENHKRIMAKSGTAQKGTHIVLGGYLKKSIEQKSRLCFRSLI